MSVMACCDRHYCDNIVCDKLVDDSYLCDRCYGQLLEMVRGWPQEMSIQAFKQRLDDFLRSDPEEREVINPVEYLEKITR